jgi:hypothetical protein
LGRAPLFFLPNAAYLPNPGAGQGLFVCLPFRSQHGWAPWQAAPKWETGWKAVQDAREKEKAKRAAEEARRASADAVIGKQFQEKVAQACAVGAEALGALNADGYLVMDNFLGAEACAMMRAEAEKLLASGAMSLGQSTRWNAKSQAVETYAKDNVFTMQVQGGSEYTASPRLVEYIVEITKGLSGALNAANKAPVLQTTVQTNKLAVCLGDGSQYAKHYDNAGGIDRRKLTALYYMNPNWAKDQGGTFRAFPSKGAPEEYIDIEPIADRLLCFWSDELGLSA